MPNSSATAENSTRALRPRIGDTFERRGKSIRVIDISLTKVWIRQGDTYSFIPRDTYPEAAKKALAIPGTTFTPAK